MQAICKMKGTEMTMNLNAVISLTANVNGTERVERFNKAFSNINGSAQGAVAAFANIGNAFGSFSRVMSAVPYLGAVVGFQQIGQALKAAVDNADNLNDLSQRTGIAVERLSQFSTVARMSGTDIGSVAIGLKTLAKNMVEAANGNADLSRLFQTLQINVRNSDGTMRDAGQVLLDLSSRFRDMQDGAVKSALAVKLLGKSGDEMIPMLNEGANKIERFKAVVGSDFAQASDQFNDRLVTLGNSFDTLTSKLANSFLPVGNSVVKMLTEALNGLSALGENVDKQPFRSFGRGPLPPDWYQKQAAAGNDNPGIQISISKPPQRPHGFDMALKMSDRAEALAEIAGQGLAAKNLPKADAAARTMNNTLNQTNVIVDGLWKRSQTFAEGSKSGLSQVGAMANDVGGAIEDAMTGAFRNAEDAFVSFVQTGKVDFSSLINSMIADMARAQFRQLTSSLFGGFNFGNIFGSLFGGGTASVPLPPIRPYAMGTDYAQGGLSLVGENGPELVRLPRGASVTPSHKLGGMGGTTINQNFTFTGGVTEKDLARILPEVSKAGANMALSQIAGGRLSARMA